MSGWRLFLRARRQAAVAVGVALVGAVTLALGHRVFLLRYGSGASVPYATLTPAFSAGLVALSCRSGMHEWEQAAARPLAAYRAVSLGLVLGWAIVWTVLAQPAVPGSLGDAAAVRNLLGFVGIALGTGAAIGGRLAWVGPLVTAITVLSLGSSVTGSNVLLVWPLAPDSNVAAWSAALLLFLAGTVLVVVKGTREPRDEVDA
jgi:hypothetical protein